MKHILIAGLLVLSVSGLTFAADKQADCNQVARRGCCSHHNGVCGCANGMYKCCDGSLSPTCECGSKSDVGLEDKIRMLQPADAVIGGTN